jgi:hypothetical protein
MKALVILISIAISGFISACIWHKAKPNEKVLFVENNKTSFYIISSIPNQFTEADPHFCLLMVADVKNGKQSLRYYTSIYKPSDTSFTSYHYYSDSLVIDTSYQFPITSIFERIDSSNLQKWNWQLNRNKLILDATDKKTNFSFKAKLRYQNPFVMNQVKNQPTIFCVEAMDAKTKLDEIIRVKYSSKLFISIIKDGNLLFKTYANQYLVWVSWVLKSGQTQTNCFALNTKGETQTLFEGASALFNLPVNETNEFWMSKSTQKNYPLYWNIKDEKTNQSYLLKPCIVNQELNFKNNSFWMGAINILDVTGKELIGKGNMYILKL